MKNELRFPDDFINQVICDDWLRAIRYIPDESIDLIIADPPYIVNDFDGLLLELNNESMRILRERRLAFVWIPRKKLYGLDSYGFDFEVFISVKNFAQGRPSNYLVDAWVPILMWRKGGRIDAKGGRNWFMINTANTNPKSQYNRKYMNFDHPNIKDMNLIKYLIGISSRENDLVLDPFLGSGQTAVACEELNRRFIGIEIISDLL